jgi:peptidoglycan/xylan/chitin deacetylase (PgdA/CDA1 family)
VGTIRALARARAKTLVYRATASFARQLYGGAGSILSFHRVVDDPPRRRCGYCRSLETSTSALERLLRRLRAQGYAIVPLEEALASLQRPVARGRFVVLTFDDGYADWATHVHPLLSSLGAPFTVYVATGYPDRTIVPWGILLERLLATIDELAIDLTGSEEHFNLVRDDERERAFDRLIAVLEGADARASRDLGARLFGEETILRQDIAIRWEQLAGMAADPLVTIGAHTVSHPILSELPEEAAAAEMRLSKQILEERLHRPVVHFAYPFGGREHARTREFRLASDCGFASAVTTRLGNVFPESDRAALPRISGETNADIELAMTGVISAFQQRGRRIVRD